MSSNTDHPEGQLGDLHFQDLLSALARPAAFPYSVSEPIVVIQTHASAVLLAGDRAYKLKKPENFGFFDYSTPALRRHFCAEEVRLNARLAPHEYLGVAPVVALAEGRPRFGTTVSEGLLPEPGTALDGGRVIDYAVVMVRLPDEAMLESLVRANQADTNLLAAIARTVAEFHTRAETSEHIAHFGEREVIRANWEENFAQMRPYVGQTLDDGIYASIMCYARDFMRRREQLFTARVPEGRIRDCHGDLRLQHVYRLETGGSGIPPLAIIDCIEFNDRFRYSDVAAEIAFLAMELDAAGRADLSRAFVEAYVAASEDTTLRELLPFYLCYRACVRGKVLSFQLDQPEVPLTQREAVTRQARALFELAARYAENPTAPMLLMVGGMMGTGKSTLALALGRTLGWQVISSDETRKRLAGTAPTSSHADTFGTGLYSADWTARTYAALLREAEKALATGRSVILDASFARRNDRQAAGDIATSAQAHAIFIECRCPRKVALARLARRWRQHVEPRGLSVSAPSRASDGRPDLYGAQRAAWEAVTPKEATTHMHIPVTTTQPLAVCVERLLQRLGVMRLACWL